MNSRQLHMHMRAYFSILGLSRSQAFQQFAYDRASENVGQFHRAVFLNLVFFTTHWLY